MDQLAEYVDGLPNICGSESLIDEAIRSHGQAPVFWRDGTGDPFAGSTALARSRCICTSR